MKLFTRYLNSAAVFSPPDDPRSAAQIERDSIEVNESTVNDKALGEDWNNPKDDKEGDEKEEEGDKDADDDSDNEETDDEKDNEDDDDKEKEETAEEKSARIAKEKEDRREARVQKRIDRAVAAQRNAEAEVEKLKKQLQEKPKEGLTEEEVERRAALKAAEEVAKKSRETLQQEFEKTVDKLEAAAIKADKEFIRKVSDLVAEVGKPVPAHMISIMNDLDNENGGEVFSYLASNPDEYEDIMDLPERKLAIKLTRLSDKLKEEKKPKPKERSKVPAPVNPINDNGTRNNNIITGKESQEEFNRKRAAQEKARREAQGY